MATLDELGTFLAAQLPATLGTDLFLGALPDTPDACWAVFEHGGLPAVHTMSGGAGSAKLEQPRMQIIARAARDDYAAARTKAETARKKLDGLANTVLSGTRYLSVLALDSPALVRWDDNGRAMVGVNFQVVKELSL